MIAPGPAHRLPQPQRVAVVGAGMVGLSTAWFLQEHGVSVTVLERDHVAAGASWGNAGWLTPSITTPLPEPAVLRYGLRSVLNPASALYVPLTLDPQLWRFLAGFVGHSTVRRWQLAMRAYLPTNRRALEAFDTLAAGGVQAQTHEADPLLVCFAHDGDRRTMVEEFGHIQAAGQAIDYELLTGAEAREVEPLLSGEVRAAIRVHRQRYLDPPQFLESLADAVRQRGGDIIEGVTVDGIRVDATGVIVDAGGGEEHRYDAVVIATGAWLGRLARRFGVRLPVQAGRGYSFSVPVTRIPSGPLYLPVQRVACTPLGDRLRIAGMMEFRRPDAPVDPRRIGAIVEATRPMLRGVDFDAREDEWVGPRPVTPDGLPLVGRTASPRVLVAGGHGMWGIVLGPVTGQLLAESITTGITPPELTPFDPLR